MRKALSKKTRFEVFKRDSFTCQYCGSMAPDVVLNVDHIIPVAKGGDNHLLNLTTACFSCNSGKKDRSLSDNTIVKKQISQLSEINEKRLQIEMLSKWRSSLLKLENETLEEVRDLVDTYLSPVNRTVADEYLNTDLKRSLKKYGFSNLCEAIDKSATQYLKNLKSKDDRNKFLEMIPKICYWQQKEIENPIESKLRKLSYNAKYYWSFVRQRDLFIKLQELNDDGLSVEELEKILKISKNYYDFEERCIDLLGEDYE